MEFASISSFSDNETEETPDISNLKDKNEILNQIRNDFFGLLAGKSTSERKNAVLNTY